MTTAFRLTGYDPAGTTGIQTAIAGATLNAVANGAFAWGAEIDNTADGMPYGTLTAAFSAGVTLTAPAFWSWYLVEPDAAGNYTASSGDPGLSQWLGNVRVAGSSVQYLPAFRIPIILPPKFKIVGANNLGAATPSNTSAVCQLRRQAETGI